MLQGGAGASTAKKVNCKAQRTVIGENVMEGWLNTCLPYTGAMYTGAQPSKPDQIEKKKDPNYLQDRIELCKHSKEKTAPKSF